MSEPFILNPPRYELAAVPVVNPPVIFTFPLSTVKTSVIISGSLPADAIFLIQNRASAASSWKSNESLILLLVPICLK